MRDLDWSNVMDDAANDPTLDRIDWAREGTDEPCSAGTAGCCIDHSSKYANGCETW